VRLVVSRCCGLLWVGGCGCVCVCAGFLTLDSNLVYFSMATCMGMKGVCTQARVCVCVCACVCVCEYVLVHACVHFSVCVCVCGDKRLGTHHDGNVYRFICHLYHSLIHRTVCVCVCVCV